jgi:1-acyl-sn-glycerol-3-phosphate acyltransferase
VSGRGILFALGRRYARRRLRAAFDGVHVEGLDALREASAAEPLIVAPNHVSWWDALLILCLDGELEGRGYCLMDAANLDRLPFFRWLGAVPLARHSRRDTLKDLASAARLLDGPGRRLWIFPQGRMRPQHLRPLELQRGVSWLARKAEARVQPLSLAYLYREMPEPALAASFSPPLPADASLDDLERALVAGLARCDAFVTSSLGAFDELVAPRRARQVPVLARALSSALGGRGEGARG